MAKVDSCAITANEQEINPRLKNSLEYAQCAASAAYFLNKFAIIKNTDGGFIPFDLFEYQESALEDFRDHNLIVVLKNRQVGWTWLVAGYALWKAIFFKAANIIIVSKSEDAATEVLDYCRFIFNKLPEYFKPDMDRNRTSLLSFPDTGSKIRALSSQKSSGIGFGSASLVVLDENDFHPYALENYIEIKPMIDAGGDRQLIILSAPNREELNSNFKDIWRGARKGVNNFHPIFTPFGAVPYHTEEWLAERTKEYPLREVETRYFRTEEEAMSVTTAGKFFDPEKLAMMFDRVINPLTTYDGLDTRNGVITIYKPPVGSFRYCLFTDPSEGKEDPFHMVVVDSSTKEEVAHAHGWFPADEVALIHDTLVRHYNNARNSFYRTGYSGARFQIALESLHTPSQVYSRQVNGKEQIGQFGYWESGQMKKQLLGNLRDGLWGLEYVIHDVKALDEMNKMIWETKQDGTMDSPAVPRGEHDDRITAWYGVVDLLRRSPKTSMNIVTYVPDKKGEFKGASRFPFFRGMNE